MSKEDLILIGGGGHCKSCIDVIETQGKFNIVGIVDKEERVGQEVLGYKVIASDSALPSLARKYKNFFITIGSIKNPQHRVERFEYLKKLGVHFPIIISPLAHVSKSAVLEEGTIVMSLAMVNADAKIGKNCIINTAAVIEHESIIGDHCHISAGTVINGTCRIGKGVFVGSATVVGNNVDIADNVIIGAGSFVAKSITQEGIYNSPGKLVGFCKV